PPPGTPPPPATRPGTPTDHPTPRRPHPPGPPGGQHRSQPSNVARPGAGPGNGQDGAMASRSTVATLAALALAASLLGGCGDDHDGAEPAPTPPPAPTTTVAAGADPGAPDGAADPLGGFEPAPLAWAPCGDVECAALAVPLDWADPEG